MSVATLVNATPSWAVWQVRIRMKQTQGPPVPALWKDCAYDVCEKEGELAD